MIHIENELIDEACGRVLDCVAAARLGRRHRRPLHDRPRRTARRLWVDFQRAVPLRCADAVAADLAAGTERRRAECGRHRAGRTRRPGADVLSYCRLSKIPIGSKGRRCRYPTTRLWRSGASVCSRSGTPSTVRSKCTSARSIATTTCAAHTKRARCTTAPKANCTTCAKTRTRASTCGTIRREKAVVPISSPIFTTTCRRGVHHDSSAAHRCKQRNHMHIDLLSPASFSNGHPHDQYRWLRENAPAYWHDEPGGRGFWAVTRFDDVREMGRDTKTFSSEPTIMIPDPPPGGTMAFGDHKMMLMMDPPQHTAFRKSDQPRVHAGAGRSAAPPCRGVGAADRRRGDRTRRMRLRRGHRRRNAVVRDRRTDGIAARRRPQALSADRNDPLGAGSGAAWRAGARR